MTTTGGCAAPRHGTEGAYRNARCRCPDAREAYRLAQKRRREGRNQPSTVDRTGTSRRLRALAALGWNRAGLAERLGISVRSLRNLQSEQDPRQRRTVTRTTADRVAALYEQLSATPGEFTRTRDLARRSGWAPPLLWEDVDIDDPNARPVDDQPVNGRGVDLDEVAYLASWGVPLGEIAARLDVAPESIAQARRRRDARQQRPDGGGQTATDAA